MLSRKPGEELSLGQGAAVPTAEILKWLFELEVENGSTRIVLLVSELLIAGAYCTVALGADNLPQSVRDGVGSSCRDRQNLWRAIKCQ